MGKIARSEAKTIKDPQDYPISKKKTLLTNLNSYIRMLKENFPDMSSKLYLKNVHRFISKIKRKLNYTDQQKLVEARSKIKICVKCEGWSSNKPFIRCNLCEDFYHMVCLKKCPSVKEKEEWYCETCDNEQKKKRNDKNEHLRNSAKYDECEKCERGRVQGEAFVNCIKCNLKYHKTCYGKPNAVCYKCHHEIQKQLKQKPKNKSLFDFKFTKTESSKKRSPSPAKNNKNNDEFKIFGKFLISDNESTNFIKKSKFNEEDEDTQPTKNKVPTFTKNFPKMTDEEVDFYAKQLLYAIKTKKMIYTPELIFEDHPSSENLYEESLNFGLQQMSKKQEQIYEKYQKQPFGPYRLVFTEGMGYDVIADMDLPASMLVCEYVGQVVNYRKVIQLEFQNEHNDSLFELSTGINADETLYIKPEKYTNLGRFINGVNNKTGKSKINVSSIRLFHKGKPGVFLYTTRSIKKGESLAYDYNGGTLNAYPTGDFL